MIYQSKLLNNIVIMTDFSSLKKWMAIVQNIWITENASQAPYKLLLLTFFSYDKHTLYIFDLVYTMQLYQSDNVSILSRCHIYSEYTLKHD